MYKVFPCNVGNSNAIFARITGPGKEAGEEEVEMGKGGVHPFRCPRTWMGEALRDCSAVAAQFQRTSRRFGGLGRADTLSAVSGWSSRCWGVVLSNGSAAGGKTRTRHLSSCSSEE